MAVDRRSEVSSIHYPSDSAPPRTWRSWLISRPLATADAPIGKVVGLAVFASGAPSISVITCLFQQRHSSHWGESYLHRYPSLQIAAQPHCHCRNCYYSGYGQEPVIWCNNWLTREADCYSSEEKKRL